MSETYQTPMYLYQFQFFDYSGAILRHYSVMLPTDPAAVKIGKLVLARERANTTLEVWRLCRCVNHELPLEGTFFEL
jgi:hypothetical protein